VLQLECTLSMLAMYFWAVPFRVKYIGQVCNESINPLGNKGYVQLRLISRYVKSKTMLKNYVPDRPGVSIK